MDGFEVPEEPVMVPEPTPPEQPSSEEPEKPVLPDQPVREEGMSEYDWQKLDDEFQLAEVSMEQQTDIYERDMKAHQKILVKHGRAMAQYTHNRAKREEYLRLKKEYGTKKIVCGWLYDNFFVACCVGGEKHFGLLVRPYNYPDAKVMVKGEERVCITRASQAFGLVMYQNCRLRWESIFKFKKIPANKKVSVPAYNKDKPDTFMYKAKWSVGQGKGSA